MIDFNEVFIIGDQPVTCPICGARTDFILQTSPVSNQEVQIHKCLSDDCHFNFVAEVDEIISFNNEPIE